MSTFDPYLHVTNYVEKSLSESEMKIFENALAKDKVLRTLVEDFVIYDQIADKLIDSELKIRIRTVKDEINYEVKFRIILGSIILFLVLMFMLLVNYTIIENTEKIDIVNSTESNIIPETVPIYESEVIEDSLLKSKVVDSIYRINKIKNCHIDIRANKINFSEYQLSAVASVQEPIRYSWSNGSSKENVLVNSPGNYCVTITTASGCTSHKCFNLKPEFCSINTSYKILDGNYFLFSQTGTSPDYQVVWNNGMTGQNIQVDTPGIYCASISNSWGCKSQSCVEIPKPLCQLSIWVDDDTEGKYFLRASSFSRVNNKFYWNKSEEENNLFEINKSGKFCVQLINGKRCKVTKCIEVYLIEGCDALIIKKKVDGKNQLSINHRLENSARFEWNSGDTSSIINLYSSGEYCLKIDSKFCKKTSCIVFNN